MFALNTSRELHFHRIDNTDVLRDAFLGNLDASRACDIIFTCGDFANRLRRRFPGAAVVSVSDADEFWNLAPSFVGRRVQTIGGISTGLLDFVISEPKAMRFLCQLCKQKLLLSTKFQGPVCKVLRSSLHTAGFYEVVSEEGDNEGSRFDFSSVSCHPVGVHELESRSLGFEDHRLRIARSQRFDVRSITMSCTPGAILSVHRRWNATMELLLQIKKRLFCTFGQRMR